MKNKAGIWLDLRGALLVLGQSKEVIRVPSDVEEGNLHGGHGSGTHYLAQDATSESQRTERRKHQLKAYFGRVVAALPEVDNLLIFGPGETRKWFKKALDEEYPNLAKKVMAVDPADTMTENQLRAHVREFFART